MQEEIEINILDQRELELNQIQISDMCQEKIN